MKLLPPSEFEKPKATAGGVLPEVKSAADEILALKLENQRLRYRHYMYWVIQRSWFARVNALCNLSRKKSQEVAAHFLADF